jgi:hypothetical protein
MKTFSTIVLVIICILAVIYFLSKGNSFTFTAEVDGVSVEGSRSVAKYSDGLLRVFTVLKGEDKGIIIIINASKPGVYSLNEGGHGLTGNHGQYASTKSADVTMANATMENSTTFLTSDHYTGKCQITTLDLTNKKVSGTFEFEAAQLTSSGYGPRVVRITKGIFEDIPIE